MPFGAPQSIRQEVERIASIVRADGGYIFCTAHNIQADTRVENVRALLRAYHEVGSLSKDESVLREGKDGVT
jgi:uroporphyrinogen-III decarboxylase